MQENTRSLKAHYGRESIVASQSCKKKGSPRDSWQMSSPSIALPHFPDRNESYRPFLFIYATMSPARGVYNVPRLIGVFYSTSFAVTRPISHDEMA